MWTSTDLPETIFRCSIRLLQTDTTCWTIQIHSDKLNGARRRTFHELNSLSLFRLMKSSTFGLGLTKKNKILGIFTSQNFISLSYVLKFRGRNRKLPSCVYVLHETWNLRHFHVVVVQPLQRKLQKGVMHVQSCWSTNLKLFFFAVLVAVDVVVA